MTRIFSKYSSLQNVKVVRDKRSSKTKGYGFLSFKDSKDYLRAMKEMNGKIFINCKKLSMIAKMDLYYTRFLVY